jgi:hypothetical protein
LVLSLGQEADAATFVVDNNAFDLPDTLPGDGVAIAADGTTTLRAAIDESNALAGQDTILLEATSFLCDIASLESGFVISDNLD